MYDFDIFIKSSFWYISDNCTLIQQKRTLILNKYVKNIVLCPSKSIYASVLLKKYWVTRNFCCDFDIFVKSSFWYISNNCAVMRQKLTQTLTKYVNNTVKHPPRCLIASVLLKKYWVTRNFRCDFDIFVKAAFGTFLKIVQLSGRN